MLVFSFFTQQHVPYTWWRSEVELGRHVRRLHTVTVRRALQARLCHISNPPHCPSHIYSVFLPPPLAQPPIPHPPPPSELPSLHLVLLAASCDVCPVLRPALSVSLTHLLLSLTVYVSLPSPAVRSSPRWRTDSHVCWPTIKHQSLFTKL